MNTKIEAINMNTEINKKIVVTIRTGEAYYDKREDEYENSRLQYLTNGIVIINNKNEEVFYPYYAFIKVNMIK